MLDIKLIRENPEKVKESQRKRGMDEKDVDIVIELDKEWRKSKEEVDKLRSRRNKISEEINKAKKENKSTDNLVKEAKEIPKLLEERDKLMKDKENERDKIWREIPNIVDSSVPVGGIEKNKIIEEHGKIPEFDFTPKDHADLLNNLNLLDTQKASDVAA